MITGHPTLPGVIGSTYRSSPHNASQLGTIAISFARRASSASLGDMRFLASHRVGPVIALSILFASSTASALPAFPGAEGFAAEASGGRGGKVIKVTTLASSGPGSLAFAAAQSGPRIIVFEVSGVIEGDVTIENGDVTIAGQTAPGAGITIHGHLYTPFGPETRNIVVRHIRVRPPGANADFPPAGHDGIQMSTARLVMLDHVDVSHGIDENIDFWGGAQDITVQWSTISFPNPHGGHPDGVHNYCLINADGDSGGVTGGRISIHHNLFAHCKTRTPALSVGPAEVRNNVVYGSRDGFVHHNAAYGDFNIIGNYYRSGPNFSLTPFWFDPENATPKTRYFLADNQVDDPGTFEGHVDDPFAAPGFDYTFYDENVLDQSHFNQVGEFDFSGVAGHVPVTMQSPLDAYGCVLDHTGAWPRDFVSKRAVAETRARTGQWENVPLEGHMLDGLTPGQAPADADEDGMPDAWESARGLDPNKDDANTSMPSGYTAIEVYLNELSDALVNPWPCGGGPAQGGTGGEDVSGSSGSSGSSGTAGSGGSNGLEPGGDEALGSCSCQAAGSSQQAGAFSALALLGGTLVSRRRARRRVKRM